MLIGNYGVGIVPLSVDQIYVFITEIFTKMTKASEKIMTSQCDYCDNSEINGSIIWALTREAQPLLYTNNNSADQPAHVQSIQRLCSSFSGNYYESTCYAEYFNILASLCS